MLLKSPTMHIDSKEVSNQLLTTKVQHLDNS